MGKARPELIARFQEAVDDPVLKFEGMNDETTVNITAYVLQANGAKVGVQLKRSTLALDVVDGKRKAVTLPAAAVVSVVSADPTYSGLMVDVLWEGRRVTMFMVALQQRGTEILFDRSAKA